MYVYATLDQQRRKGSGENEGAHYSPSPSVAPFPPVLLDTAQYGSWGERGGRKRDRQREREEGGGERERNYDMKACKSDG